MNLEHLYENTNFTHALIDGDLIVYRAGFGAKPGEPIEHSLHNAKNIMANILEHTACEEFRLFLTGKDNFRDIVAVTKKYKGNRDNAHKPEFYKELREYMVNAWAGEVVDGMEADDAVSILQHQLIEEGENPVLVSTDKDLNMVPGWHHNWVKDKTYFIDQFKADAWFWCQCLTGDQTDNIQGVPGLGEKKAEKLLADKSLAEMEEIVRREYDKAYGEKGQEVFSEMANLLWMLREPPNGELKW